MAPSQAGALDLGGMVLGTVPGTQRVLCCARWEAAEGWSRMSCARQGTCMPSQAEGRSAAGAFRCWGFIFYLFFAAALCAPCWEKQLHREGGSLGGFPQQEAHAFSITGKERRLLTVSIKNKLKKIANAAPSLPPPPPPDEAPVPHKGFITAMQHSPSLATSSSARWAPLKKGGASRGWQGWEPLLKAGMEVARTPAKWPASLPSVLKAAGAERAPGLCCRCGEGGTAPRTRCLSSTRCSQPNFSTLFRGKKGSHGEPHRAGRSVAVQNQVTRIKTRELVTGTKINSVSIIQAEKAG